MKNKMFLLILISIFLGIICGIFFPKQMLTISWIGKVFINLLKLIVLPLIFCSLVSAITALGGGKRLGSIGIYTFCYVFFSISLAVLIGLVLLNVFKPGVGIPPELILANATPSELKTTEISAFLMTLFPPNIIEAAAKYEIMPIVFFSIVFAIACIAVGDTSKPVVAFFLGVRDVLIKMIIWLMYLTPLGLFSLLGTAIAEASIQNKLLTSLKGLLIFVAIFLFGLLCQFMWQLALIKYLVRKNTKQFMGDSSNALLTAFATSSSLATLPVTLMAARKQQISEDVARFVIPLATTINMAGTAMYEAVSTLFFCQILDLHLSIWAQIGVFVTAILAGIGGSGIPEGGLVTMIMVLRTVNVPTSAIALLLPFDRILDRFRTMVNVWGDLVCAATVDHFTKQNSTKNSG